MLKVDPLILTSRVVAASSSAKCILLVKKGNISVHRPVFLPSS